MSYPHRCADKIHARHAPCFALDPRRTKLYPFHTIQSERNVDDVTTGLLGHVPGVARESIVGGEKDEIDALHMLRQDALDERGLIPNGLQLSERLIVIQQPNVMRGEVPLIENIFDFAPLQSGSADDGDAEETAPASGFCMGDIGFRTVLHQAREASSWECECGRLDRRNK